MTLEEFIMKNYTWIDLIVALGTLISVFVSIFVLLRSEKTTRTLMEKDHSILDKNDSNLSKEHDELSSLISTQIAEKHQQTQKQQDEIKQVVTYLKENTLCEQAKKEILSQQALDIQRTSEHISALVDLLHNTQIENLQLKQENQELKFKIHQYEVQFNSEDEMEP